MYGGILDIRGDNMKKRIIGGAILAAIVIPCFLIGGVVFDIFCGIVGLLALFELINADKDIRKQPLALKGVAFISIPLIAFMNLDHSLITGFDPISILIPIVLLIIPALFLNEKGYGMKEAFRLAFMSIFVGIVTNLYITVFNSNKWLLLWLMLIAMGTDIFAYVGGRLIGKHKFTKISPNKTLEGCVIGSIVGTFIAFIFYTKVFVVTNGALIFGVTLLLTVVGQMGDLIFSLIKRENNIKDFSHIIPGHGGVCDRIDSLTFIVLVFIIIFRYL